MFLDLPHSPKAHCPSRTRLGPKGLGGNNRFLTTHFPSRCQPQVLLLVVKGQVSPSSCLPMHASQKHKTPAEKKEWKAWCPEVLVVWPKSFVLGVPPRTYFLACRRRQDVGL